MKISWKANFKSEIIFLQSDLDSDPVPTVNPDTLMTCFKSLFPQGKMVTAILLEIGKKKKSILLLFKNVNYLGEALIQIIY